MIFVFLFLRIAASFEQAMLGRVLMGVRKGTNGVSANGVTANFMLFDRGTFWVLSLTCFCLPKSARAYLFPQSVKVHYFCGGPISADPICPQPRRGHRHRQRRGAVLPQRGVAGAGARGKILHARNHKHEHILESAAENP